MLSAKGSDMNGEAFRMWHPSHSVRVAETGPRRERLVCVQCGSTPRLGTWNEQCLNPKTAKDIEDDLRYRLRRAGR